MQVEGTNPCDGLGCGPAEHHALGAARTHGRPTDLNATLTDGLALDDKE
jgi:hypothetical protein